MCVYSFQCKIIVAKVHMVPDRGTVAKEEERSLWFCYFYTLGGRPKAGLSGPLLTWALLEVG